MIFSKDELAAAHGLVLEQMDPTPQYIWPLLSMALGTELVVKHENHGPTGAFKIRGGITFIDWLCREYPEYKGIITATRGNHGQSQARAAVAAGLSAKVLVPRGNSVEKNAAMRAFGAELIEFGDDFDEAKVEAMRLAEEERLYPVPPFHREILRGVATYGYEMLSAHPDLDVIYVPIGCGSGLCGTLAARDALGLKTEVVGVVSSRANCAKLSFEAGYLVETGSANTFADGVAVRVPVQEAFDIYSKGVSRIVEVSDVEVADAMRLYFRCIHNVAEGAGAVSLAAAMQERALLADKKAGVVLTGGNLDTRMFEEVLAGRVPTVGNSNS